MQIAWAFLAWATIGCSCDEQNGFELNAKSVASVPFRTALFQSTGAQMSPGNSLRIVNNGAVFDVLAEQISKARTSIHVAMYIWEPGAASERVVSAIEQRTAGVSCRILVDDFGSPRFGENVGPRLERVGCEVRIFRPLAGDDTIPRNHRKLVVLDGKTAITGGFGIRDEWLGHGVRSGEWRDTNVLFEGPVVRAAQQAFAENWLESGGAVLSETAFPPLAQPGSSKAALVTSTDGVVTRAERLMQLMIAAASSRIWISNAYFVPSDGILKLLNQKAKSGVDVRLLVPGDNSDSKTAFIAQHTISVLIDNLREHGVKVWEYTASMMHSKTMIVDDGLVLVGSINLEPLSLQVLEEAALVAVDKAIAEALAHGFLQDCSRATPLK